MKRFIKATNYRGKDVIINTDMITQVIPDRKDAGLLMVYLSASDDGVLIRGDIETFFRKLQGTSIEYA